MTKLEIYTDGSSSKNGTPECYAGWALAIPDFEGKTMIQYGDLPAPSSNNKGEIMGVLLAVQMFHKQTKFSPIIYSDSQYVVKSCNEWRHKWKRDNYSGVKNKQLLIPLFEMLDADLSGLKIVWVKAHNGTPGNELADEYCGYGKIKRDMSVHYENKLVTFIEYNKLIERFPKYETTYNNN